MNQIIKSHWKMVYRVTKKALTVTVQTMIVAHRAKLRIAKLAPEINSQRAGYKKIDELSNDIIITRF